MCIRRFVVVSFVLLGVPNHGAVPNQGAVPGVVCTKQMMVLYHKRCCWTKSWCWTSSICGTSLWISSFSSFWEIRSLKVKHKVIIWLRKNVENLKRCKTKEKIRCRKLSAWINNLKKIIINVMSNLDYGQWSRNQNHGSFIYINIPSPKLLFFGPWLRSNAM